MLNPNPRELTLWLCLLLITGAPFYFKLWLDRARPLFAETVQKKTTLLSFLIFAALFTGGFLLRQENAKAAGALLFASILSFSFLYQVAGRYQDRMNRGSVSAGASPKANLRQTAGRFFFGALLLFLFSKNHLLILFAPFLLPLFTPLFTRFQYACTPMSSSPLKSEIEAVFNRESVPLSGIFIIDEPAMAEKNAFVSGSGFGIGPFGRTLFITLPLVQALEPAELTAVVLHEAAHARLHHPLKRILASTLLMAASAFWVVLPTAFLAPSHFAAISVSMLAAVLVQALLLSRVIVRQEHEADLLAVQMGASSNALSSALRKLAPEKGEIENGLWRVLSGNLYPSVKKRLACINDCEVPREARLFQSPSYTLAYSLTVLGVLFWSAGNLHESAKISRSDGPVAVR